MKKIIILLLIFTWVGTTQSQTLPKEYQKDINVAVETLYPSATLKPLSNDNQSFNIIQNGQSKATLYLLTGEGPENKFTFFSYSR